MEKVKLPRHVAEALEEAKGRAKGSGPEWVAWCIPNEEMKGIGEYWGVLYDFGNEPGGFFKLIDALRYGYDIQPEPITVTITPKQQEQIKEFYTSADPVREEIVRRFLELLRLEIPGVNA